MPVLETRSIFSCPIDSRGLQPTLEKFAIAAEPRFDEIDTAIIALDDGISSDVVRMNLATQFQDLNSVERFDLSLVHAGQIDGSSRQLLGAAPVGAAHTFLAEGGEIEWPLFCGDTYGLRVLKVRSG